MSEKNLPIKIVLQKTADNQKNTPGGGTKFFSAVTPELQVEIIAKFENLRQFYEGVFSENENVPAVGKIVMKPEAIAKSHKPCDLCRNLPIIGSENLDEVYVKVTEKTIADTVDLVRNPPSKAFRANLTAVLDIKPVTSDDKISKELNEISQQGKIDSIKKRIKIKLFDFDDDFDDDQINEYIKEKLQSLVFGEKYQFVTYGEKIK